MKHFLASTIALACLASTAQAATIGAPTITADIDNIKPSYEYYGDPALGPDWTTIVYSGTIDSTVGLPNIVGDPFSFERYITPVGAFTMSFKIGETELVPGYSEGPISIEPPIASAVDNNDGTSTYTFADDYAAFGPITTAQWSWSTILLTFDIQRTGHNEGTIFFQTIGGTPLPPAPVPLPASGMLILAGLFGLAATRLKRANQSDPRQGRWRPH